MLIDSKPFFRDSSITSFVCLKLCTLLTAFCTSWSKSWTPRLIRLNLAIVRDSIRLSSIPRGSISIEYSPSVEKLNDCCSLLLIRIICSPDKKVGVPPPKCICSTSRSLSNKEDCISISLNSASIYGSALFLSLVTTLLQPQ